jgi:GNAT superfamily N-acetyltransferase
MTSAPSPSTDQPWRCERATSAHADGLLALFEGAGSGCFCNYWYFEGDKNAWLERCYIKPEENRAALVQRLSGPELCGVVALSPREGLNQHSERSERHETETVCGWMNLSRVGSVPRLYDQRVYRNLPCFQGAPVTREHVYAVACCYVAEAQRGRGVARALLHEAIQAVRAAGGSAIEAFPRASPGTESPGTESPGTESPGTEAERLRPDQVWLGPEALFQGAGFAAVSDFRPYPVLRLHLR